MTANLGDYHASPSNCRHRKCSYPSIPRIVVAGKNSQADRIVLWSRPVGVAAVNELRTGSQCRILLAHQRRRTLMFPHLVPSVSD
jgi:hypothetical protein